MKTKQSSPAIVLHYPTTLHSMISRLQEKYRQSKSSYGTTNLAPKKNNIKRYIPLILLILVVGAAIFWTVKLFGNLTSGNKKSGDNRVSVLGAKATATINREFNFPIKDGTGKVVTSVKYYIESVEKRDEIIVQGQRAVAVKGRTFFIVTIKLTNSFNKIITFNARDYIRLSLNNSPELLAADIHNDPIDLQAISTKETRLGFPINDTDKNLILHVGEVNGDKTEIPVKF